MDLPPLREADLFQRALELPEPERAAYLTAACGSDTSLRQRVDRLLLAHANMGDFLSAPAISTGNTLNKPAAPTPASSIDPQPGDRIGRYRLREKVGEGGCGLVYLAEQEEPIRRRVALKVIKLGMDTHEALARFESERQALASMEHPNIAQVYDAGTTDRGRPFFVMEFVPGTTLTEYCDLNKLGLEARLDLFLAVCRAVQHAHQKGVIHRDLKPSNILVTLLDNVPVPKVIDFGIAKAAQGRLTDLSLYTALERFLGTPAYMSPEQAGLGGLYIDTRSDIYSLGVLLYELLTGLTPFKKQDLLQAGLDEMRRRIREVEPPSPSTRLRTLEKETLHATAQHRKIDAPRLIRRLHGDLDWIVMRCLEKDRTRRYESASALALDLERHLTHEPVSARPPSLHYKLYKFWRRHRLGCMAALAVTVALVGGTALATRQAVLASRSEQAAERARQRAEELLVFMLSDLRRALEKIGRLDVLEDVGAKAREQFATLRREEWTAQTVASYSRTLRQMGEIYMKTARLPEAEALLREAYRQAAILVDRHPRHAGHLNERNQVEFYLGHLALLQQQLESTAHHWQKYHDTASALVALEPSQREWQSELAWGHHSLATLHCAREEFGAAVARLQEEVSLLEALQLKDSANPSLIDRLADAQSWSAEIEERLGQLGSARLHYRDSANNYLRLMTADPKNKRWGYRLAAKRIFEGNMLAIMGQADAARPLLAEALERLRGLVAHDPSNRDWQRMELTARLAEIRLERPTRGTAESLRRLEAVRVSLEQLQREAPNHAKIHQELAAAYLLEAEWRLPDHPEEAAGWVGRVIAGIETAQKAGAAKPTPNPNERSTRAWAYLLAGTLAERRGLPAEAKRHWHAAKKLLLPLPPDCRDWHLLDPAARLATALGRLDEARQWIARLSSLDYVPREPWPAAVAPPPAHSLPPSNPNP